MAAATRALTPTLSTSFTPSAPADAHSPFSSASQSLSLAPIAAAATAVALRASASPRPFSSHSPHRPARAAAPEDEHRSRADRESSADAATALISSLLGNHMSSVSAKMADAPATAQKALQIQPDQAAMAAAETLQTSPVSMSSLGSLDNSSIPATTAPTLATAMPTVSENGIGLPDHNAERPLVDPGISGPQSHDGPRAYTFPPPPSEDPRINPPQRSISLQSAGYAGGSPRSGGQRRHKCPYCSTDFTRHHNLKSHLLTHSQEKPYECETCQSRFRRLHDLKRHQKLHTGERPHTCQKCGRKFARGDALARHNKGQGGCAGRRSSFGGDSPNETMDGVEYTAEPDNMDDEEMDDARRRISEPGRQNSLSGSGRPSSTYPPLNPGRYPGNASVAPMYPPSSTPSQHSSGQNTGNGASIPPFNAAQHNVFPQSGMTESPKPLSPGHPGRHGGLPPPPVPGSGSTLPSLSGIRGPGGSGSLPGSMSSGSGNSIRDFLGRSEGEVFNYARDLEGKMSMMEQQHRDLQAQMVHMQDEHQKTINQLQEEIRSLKSPIDTKVV